MLLQRVRASSSRSRRLEKHLLQRNATCQRKNIKIEDLQEKFEARRDALEEDDDATEAIFYAQLLHGTQNLVEALTKFLSPNSSKRAHGKLEY